MIRLAGSPDMPRGLPPCLSVGVVSERYTDRPGSAWAELNRAEYDEYWTAFESRFGFPTGVSSEAWPAIREPVPSVTFDLSVIADGPQRGAAYDSINARLQGGHIRAPMGADSLRVRRAARRIIGSLSGDLVAVQAPGWSGRLAIPL